MRLTHIWTVSILAGFTALFGGCGGDTIKKSPYAVSADGFGVFSSDPAYEATYQDHVDEIRVNFNLPIDPASVAGGFRVMQLPNGSPSTDITTKGHYDVVNNGQTLVFTTPPEGYPAATQIRMSLTPAIRSTSGFQLPGTNVIFYTGDKPGNGRSPISKPGAPVVVSFSRHHDGSFDYDYVVEGAVVMFSEDVYGVSATGKYCPFDICSLGWTEDLIAFPSLSSNQRWMITFHDYGMGLVPPAKIDYEIYQAYDTEGMSIPQPFRDHVNLVW